MTDSEIFFNKKVNVIVHRPLGAKHSEKYPKHIYPVNYGHVPDTISGDGEELDAYILGIYEPIESFTGKCIAIIRRTKENDDKLIVVPENTNFTDDQIRALTNFQERFYDSIIIRPEGYVEFNQLLPELTVSNLEESLKFYLTIGFNVVYERKENKFVFLKFENVNLMLQEETENDKWELAPLSYPYGNGINFEIDTDNIERIYNALKNSNYEITFDIEENHYKNGNITYINKEFLVKDPDGYLLRFAESTSKED